MNAYAPTAKLLSEALTGVRSRRTEHGKVVASSHGPLGSRYIVSVRGHWYACKQGEKDWLLQTGDTSESTPMTDDEMDAADRGDW